MAQKVLTWSNSQLNSMQFSRSMSEFTSVRIHFRCERCVDLYMIYNYMLRMALLDGIRGWFLCFMRGKDKSSECNLSRLSIIGDILICSSPKHSCLLMVTTFLPKKALKK